jgi:transposase InsO family protein
MRRHNPTSSARRAAGLVAGDLDSFSHVRGAGWSISPRCGPRLADSLPEGWANSDVAFDLLVRARPRGSRPAPSALGAASPDTTPQAPARRPGPARRGQPRPAEITLVVLPRAARDAAALASSAGRRRLDLPAPASKESCNGLASTSQRPRSARHSAATGSTRATTGDHDLESVPARAGRRDRGLRLLHRRYGLAAAAVCADPDGGWVTQQARNLLLVLDERGRQVRFLLRDHDAKFTRSFNDLFRSQDADILVTPVRAPQANAYAERWVRTVRTECLDWLLIVGRGHLEQILRVYVQHYNRNRPHRALGLRPPDPSARPAVRAEDNRSAVRRRDLLGGLLHEYRRAA